MRQAGLDDLAAIVALTTAAYAPYTPIFGGPPVPVTEDYTPRIERGEVWLLEEAETLAGLIVLERHSDHAMIFSVAVAPAFQGRKLGIRLLDFADGQAEVVAVVLVLAFSLGAVGVVGRRFVVGGEHQRRRQGGASGNDSGAGDGGRAAANKVATIKTR